MSLIAEIKKDINGAEILLDWLGRTKQTVSQEQADRRAAACEGCEFNCAPKWWEKNLKLRVAHWIMAELEEKNLRRLAVANEEKIHMCSRCGCCLPLKVWTPIEHIRAHTPFKDVATLPDHCWMRKEITAM